MECDALKAQEESRQGLLLKVTQVILESARDEAGMVEEVFGVVGPGIGAEVCFFYVPEWGGKGLRLAWSAGVAEGTADTLGMGEAFCGTVAATRAPLSADACRIEGDARGAFVRGLGVRSYACHPLMGAGGELLGTLSFASRSRERFEGEEMAMLQTVCHSLAIAFGRRREAEALKLSRGRADFLAAAVENASQPFASGYPDGRLHMVNQAFLELTGYSEGELRGMTWSRDLTPVEWREREAGVIGELNRTGRPQAYEKEYVRKDGVRVPIELTVHLARDGVTGETFYYAFIEDVTERKRTAAAIRESESRLRLATAAAEMFVWDADVVTGKIEWSENAARVIGVPEERLPKVGVEGFFFVAPEERERLEQDMYEVMGRGEEVFYWEFQGVEAGEETKYWRSQGRVVYGGGGKPARIIGVTQDVTAEWHARAALEEAKEEAERASAAKDRFLAALSHELRTPLTPVKMLLGMWERDEEFPARLRPGLELMRRNVDLEVRLIDDLLDLQRVAKGKLVLQKAAVGLDGEARHAVESVLAEGAAKGVMLRLEAGAGEVGRVMADAARLQQVFWNLLKNAVKFTPTGGTVTVRTKMEAREEGSVVRLEVSDTGIGIEEEMLPKVFNAFEQGGLEVTRGFGGMGLGLAISKALVELHEGKVWAESMGRGRGATFMVELPVVSEAGGTAWVEGAREESGEKQIRILLVEDHDDTARVMERVLKSMGHAVRRTATVKEAVEVGVAEGFDLLVSDIGLPDGTGIEVLEALKGRLGAVKAVALTGYGMEEDVRKTREAGFLEHLTKPVDLGHLDVTIRRLAGG